jgi:NADH-quinone oxidoreductase subunit E
MSGHEFQHHFAESGGVDLSDRATNLNEKAYGELRELASRYPQPRSALLPMLHLVQSYDGRVSAAGVEACAEILGISAAQVSGVATFYTMYHRKPAGKHHIGVCTTALCAVMGGDAVLDAVEAKLGVSAGAVTADGKFSLERVECNAACDFAPVMMVNWEYFDQMTPQKAAQLLDDLAAGKQVQSPRGATVTSWQEAERVLAGFPDGRADEGPSAGPASLAGLGDLKPGEIPTGVPAAKKRAPRKKPAAEPAAQATAAAVKAEPAAKPAPRKRTAAPKAETAAKPAPRKRAAKKQEEK